MNIDGKQIAAALKQALCATIQEHGEPLSLGIVAADPSFAARKFIERKKAFAADIGVSIRERILGADATTGSVSAALAALVEDTDGVVVQLPLGGEQVDEARIIKEIPYTHDVDALGQHWKIALKRGDSAVLPPVVGAIREILLRNNIAVAGARAVVVGRGRLVGEPVADWLSARGATVTILDKTDVDIAVHTTGADIIVLGAGAPGIVTPDMISDGAIVLDAGTSEAFGRIVGDADPACAQKAALFTPVPGGIGPITIAYIFKNLLALKAANPHLN